MIAGRPTENLAPPPGVRAVVAGGTTEFVWQNELGGRTFELRSPAGHRFLKWAPAGSDLDLEREIVRLRWAADYCQVPRVIANGLDQDGSWLLTAALPGDNAVSARWRLDPMTAVRAVGAGLRALHDALPVPGCPFSWSAASRLADVHRRAASGKLDPQDWHDDHQWLGIERAIELASKPPEIDKLVVCHGDACVPNTLIGEYGKFTGHVDLGSLGVADRWADLAVATWGTEWNYGPGWQAPLLAAYGIEPDPARIAYYRLLWDLGP